MYKFVVAFAVVAASPAFAADQAAPVQQTATQQPKEKMVCRKIEEIGTRLGGKRVCKNAAEWDEERRLHAQSLGEAQRKH